MLSRLLPSLLVFGAFATQLTVAELAAQIGPRPGDAWEEIDDDLRNVRGLCYVPVYPSRQGAPDYWGVASSTAMWHEYDRHPQAVATVPGAAGQGTAGEVWQQLGWIKKLGINTVRIWISYPMWAHHDANPTMPSGGGAPFNEYLERLRHFLSLCELRNLHVMPVVWDGLGFIEPDPADWVGPQNRSSWHSNPGPATMHGFLAQSTDLVGTDAERYLLDLVDVFRNSRAFLLWDVMNEPNIGLPPDYENFIRGTMAILKTAAPEMRTNLAVLWATDRQPAALRIAQDPNLDTFGIHPYGHTRSVIEAMIWDVTHVPSVVKGAGYLRKPILATEIGKPGWGLGYEDALRFAQYVPRPDLGPEEKGVGCTPWGAMIGWEGGSFPFKETDGIFFSDGQVREKSVARAFLQMARAQGLREDLLFDSRELLEWDGGGFRVEQDLPTSHDDWNKIAELAWTPASQYVQFDWAEFSNACRLLRMVTYFLDQGPLSSLANPINDPAIEGNVVAPADLNIALWSALNLCPNDGADILDPTFRAAMGLVVNGPFTPETDPTHLQILTGSFLNDFRLALLPYLVARGGPY